MTNVIHPTAIVMDGAILGNNNHIGPFCIIHPKVKLGDNNILKSHVVLDGDAVIGDDNQFFPFASIGALPQAKTYPKLETKLIIGNNNIFREYTTANPGTDAGGLITKIGDNCLFMASSHIAHDCQVGNDVIIANCVALAGHVHVGDFAIIGGLSAVLQRTKIGAHAIIGGLSGVAEDVIPYGLVMGERAHLAGLNVVGLKRRRFSRDSINDIRRAYEMIFTNNDTSTFSERLIMTKEEFSDSEEVMFMIKFLTENNTNNNAVCKPKPNRTTHE
jgi:UDP-N-acetylglucosamine acyltransferase